jgi:hypothetical protein
VAQISAVEKAGHTWLAEGFSRQLRTASWPIWQNVGREFAVWMTCTGL